MTRRYFLLLPLRVLVTLPLGSLLVASLFVVFLPLVFVLAFFVLLPCGLLALALATTALPVGLVRPRSGRWLLESAGAVMDWANDSTLPDRIMDAGDHIPAFFERMLEAVWA